MQQVFLELVGMNLSDARRAADMEMFHFGSATPAPSAGGSRETDFQFALHVQCAWRFVRNERVWVGSRDLYHPAALSENESVPDGFDWGRDANRRDALVASLLEHHRRNLRVKHVQLELAGRLTIAFERDLYLEVFPDDAFAGEHWRIFAFEEGGVSFVQRGDGSPE